MTVTVLVTLPLLLGPLEGTVATMVKSALAPTARLPGRAHARVVSPAEVVQVQPAGAVPPVTRKPVGSTSVQRGFSAGLGISVQF